MEDLTEITLGDLTFTLPDNIEELQESLGGEGACVRVGYSLISTVNDGKNFIACFSLIILVSNQKKKKKKKKKIDVPTASLAFFDIDCQNGTW